MKNFRMVCVGALCAVGVVLCASANQIQVGYPESNSGPYRSGDGGEFTVMPVNPSGWLSLGGYAAETMDIGIDGSFQTFCLEQREELGGYGITYDAAVNTRAIFGGVGPSGDPLSIGAGFLYSQFVSGTLYKYDYTTTAGRKTSAGELQNAIWWLEDEGVAFDSNNIYMDYVVTWFGGQDQAKAAGDSWNYGVRAMNLTDNVGSRYQDLLVKVPDAGLTMTLLGVAMGFMGLATRFAKK